MTTSIDRDWSNGYEAVASQFMANREHAGIGVDTVRTWARSLTPGASVLDLGCGHGKPIAAALIADGFVVYGVDASPSLTRAFHSSFPLAQVACEAVEESSFFDRTFDAVIAVGLMFLLNADAQERLIDRVARTLNSNGRFLFTAPAEACAWKDVLTGRDSLSLGAPVYKDLLSNAQLALLGEYTDEGGNRYYDSCKPALATREDQLFDSLEP
jgi:SAM-dependent methyltransferase